LKPRCGCQADNDERTKARHRPNTTTYVYSLPYHSLEFPRIGSISTSAQCRHRVHLLRIRLRCQRNQLQKWPCASEYVQVLARALQHLAGAESLCRFTRCSHSSTSFPWLIIPTAQNGLSYHLETPRFFFTVRCYYPVALLTMVADVACLEAVDATAQLHLPIACRQIHKRCLHFGNEMERQYKFERVAGPRNSCSNALPQMRLRQNCPRPQLKLTILLIHSQP
jgi:hypothetical protein